MVWPPPAAPLGRALDVVGIGEAMVLFQTPAAETLNTARHALVDVAGAELNVCAAVASLGGRSAFLSRVGDDAPGMRVLTAMDGLGVLRTLTAVDPAGPTGLLIRETPPDGSRQVTYYRSGSAASAMDSADARRLWDEVPRAAVLSGLTAALGPGLPAFAIDVARHAAAHGTAVVLDVNLRPQLPSLDYVVATVQRLLPFTDLLVLGDDESEPVLGVTDPTAVFRAAHEAGVREVVLKGGPRGCWIEDGSGAPAAQPSLARTVVDPVGAGDAFLGGYLSARLAGAGRRGAATLGSELAAAVIENFGDTGGLPSPRHGREMLREALTLG